MPTTQMPTPTHDAPDVDTDAEFTERMYDLVHGVVPVLIGSANVIMELSQLPVGRGVAESRVTSGRLDVHPLKRTRTTLSYVAVALYGTDEERAAYRRTVNRVHAHVRSTPDSEVAYNAFSRELQLWVAACAYLGFEEGLRLTTPEELFGNEDAVYRHGKRIGTTLQVREEDWPADREAFRAYWHENLARIEMDDVTRAYLRDHATLAFLPAPFARVLGPVNLFFTLGFLPRPFREELGLEWGPRRAGAHRRIVTAIIAVSRRMPPIVRRFPMNALLADVRWRLRTGRPLV